MKQSKDFKQALHDASLLLQLTARGEADVDAGHTAPQSEVFARARRRLASRKRQRLLSAQKRTPQR